MMLAFWYSVAGWLYLALVVVLLVTVLLRKREPAAALAWSLAIVFVPLIGPFLFLLTGLNRIPRRVMRRVSHRADFVQRSEMREDLEGMVDPRQVDYPAGRWGTLGRMLEDLCEAPRRGGNETWLYNEGLEAYEAMAAAIEAAEHHVHIEFYILRDDDVGRRLIELLVGKCEQGVKVRLLVDGFGSFGGLRLLHRVRRAGGEAAFFLPLLSPGRISPNLRNHRKVVICDGRAAFFGGLNVGLEYVGRRRHDQRDWYDLHMQLRGPAVWDLQLLFIEDWSFATGALLEGNEYFPEPAAGGEVFAQVIAGGPYLEVNAIRQAYFTAFCRATERIRIASPYVVPDLALRDALKTAACSGVEVQLVTQAYPPDYRLVYYCGQYFLDELIGAGVRAYAYEPGMMHAKAVAVDGEWAMLGTANLDNRGTALNFEQMTVFDGEAAVAPIEHELQRLIELSSEIRLEDMAGRSRTARLLASGARLFAPLL